MNIIGTLKVLAASAIMALTVAACNGNNEKLAKAAEETPAVAMAETPASPALPKPLPTNQEIQASVAATMAENKLSDYDVRHLQVGQKIIVVANGQKREVTIVAGDVLWRLSQTALTDPVSARFYAARNEVTELTAQEADANRDLVALQTIMTAKTQARDRLTAQKEAADRRVAAAQNELNARRDAEAARRPANATAPVRRQHPASAARTTS